MKVNVTISLSCPPSEQYVDSLEMAALALTNAKRSVRVEERPDDNNYVLIVTFTMKTTAQYKAVGEIYKAFKSEAWDCEGYQDMSIQFPE